MSCCHACIFSKKTQRESHQVPVMEESQKSTHDFQETNPHPKYAEESRYILRKGFPL